MKKQININIDEKYLQAFGLEFIQTHLQKELDLMLLEKFGNSLKNTLDENNLILDEVSKEAKQKAWEIEKHKYLKGLIIDE